MHCGRVDGPNCRGGGYESPGADARNAQPGGPSKAFIFKTLRPAPGLQSQAGRDGSSGDEAEVRREVLQSLVDPGRYAIRLAFAFQANSLVNSICHTQPGVIRGRDSSRNVWWVGLPLLFLGENWHRNHHTVPTSARLGWNWRQADLGYLMIVGLEKLGLATDVRRLVGTKTSGLPSGLSPRVGLPVEPLTSVKGEA